MHLVVKVVINVLFRTQRQLVGLSKSSANIGVSSPLNARKGIAKLLKVVVLSTRGKLLGLELCPFLRPVVARGAQRLIN